jgi:hypothetical protein
MKNNCKPYLPTRCKAWDKLAESVVTKNVHWSYLPTMKIRKKSKRSVLRAKLLATL